MKLKEEVDSYQDTKNNLIEEINSDENDQGADFDFKKPYEKESSENLSEDLKLEKTYKDEALENLPENTELEKTYKEQALQNVFGDFDLNNTFDGNAIDNLSEDHHLKKSYEEQVLNKILTYAYFQKVLKDRKWKVKIKIKSANFKFVPNENLENNFEEKVQRPKKFSENEILPDSQEIKIEEDTLGMYAF